MRGWLSISVLSASLFLSSTVQAAHPADAASPDALDEAAAARFAQLALTCLHQEYPNKIAHVMQGDADVRPPRALTPAFYGCYDWHSAVHGHWLLVRLLRQFPDAPFATDARAALAESLTPQNIAGEVEYLRHEKRASFERPYGLAWLLQLSAELRGWDDPQARHGRRARAAGNARRGQLKAWLPKLHYPIRVGEHDQTAFAFGLLGLGALAGDAAMTGCSTMRRRASIAAIATARCATSRRVRTSCRRASPKRTSCGACSTRRFGAWLTAFLPQMPSTGGCDVVAPGVVTDRTDPKLAHIDGLNLSRAWMLEGIAHGLPADRRSGVACGRARHARPPCPPSPANITKAGTGSGRSRCT